MKLENIIGKDWYGQLQPFLESGKWKRIEQFLADKVRKKETIYPDLKNIFRPFTECPYKDLKVVVLNDAPMEDERANDGLAFSVSDTELMFKPPKEAQAFMEGIETDIYDGVNFDRSLDLKKVANQGVLLLNSALTTEFNGEKWFPHYEVWKDFIKEILTVICKNNSGIVFIFVGVKDFTNLGTIVVKSPAHYIMTCMAPKEANHFAQVFNPSHVFKLTNLILKQNNNIEIEW